MSKLPHIASFSNSQTHSVNDSAKEYDLFIPVARESQISLWECFYFYHALFMGRWG